MKIYVHEQGVQITGKAWEVLAKLKEANKHFATVKDWRDSVHSVRPKLVNVDCTAAKKKLGSS
ncbi:hypothetical protein BTS2_3640 [Bacillus sp. TS-2]|nr:hypothetical protein BTS2_3640 [Bacillus sp. TS-2]